MDRDKRGTVHLYSPFVRIRDIHGFNRFSILFILKKSCQSCLFWKRRTILIDLSEKHIFIAGGSRGIGAAAAKMAAGAGAEVSINYQSI